MCVGTPRPGLRHVQSVRLNRVAHHQREATHQQMGAAMSDNTGFTASIYVEELIDIIIQYLEGNQCRVAVGMGILIPREWDGNGGQIFPYGDLCGNLYGDPYGNGNGNSPPMATR